MYQILMVYSSTCKYASWKIYLSFVCDWIWCKWNHMHTHMPWYHSVLGSIQSKAWFCCDEKALREHMRSCSSECCPFGSKILIKIQKEKNKLWTGSQKTWVLVQSPWDLGQLFLPLWVFYVKYLDVLSVFEALEY